MRAVNTGVKIHQHAAVKVRQLEGRWLWQVLACGRGARGGSTQGIPPRYYSEILTS